MTTRLGQCVREGRFCDPLNLKRFNRQVGLEKNIFKSSRAGVDLTAVNSFGPDTTRPLKCMRMWDFSVITQKKKMLRF